MISYCLDGQHHDLDEFSALPDDDEEDNDDDEKYDDKNEDKDKKKEKDGKDEKDGEKEHGRNFCSNFVSIV